MEIIKHLLPYNEILIERIISEIDLLVFHCTELPSLQDARREAEKIIPNREIPCGNSGHYYIDRDGKVYQYVEDNRIAFHVISHNMKSIGIELINLGRYPNWFSSKYQTPREKYTKEQISVSIDLMKYLKKNIPSLLIIKKHSDLDKELVPSIDNPKIRVYKKIDPGPLLPWKEIQNKWQRILMEYS